MYRKMIFLGFLIASLGLFAEDNNNLCINKDCNKIVITDFIPFVAPCPTDAPQASMDNDELIEKIQSLPNTKVNQKRKGALVQYLLSQNQNVTKKEGSRHATSDQCPGKNVQVNDPALQGVFSTGVNSYPNYIFDQSETAIAVNKKNPDNIVVVYNAFGSYLLPNVSSFQGFSTSFDGGKTWTSGFLPSSGSPGLPLTDPYVVSDRKGNFYASFIDFATPFTGEHISVSKSTDGGLTWTTVQAGPEISFASGKVPDRPKIAVGPDPQYPSRDLLYVSWLLYEPTTGILEKNKLMLSHSKDGGKTWHTKAVYEPKAHPDPFLPQDEVQSCFITVDPKTGTVYLPFVHYSVSLSRNEGAHPPSVVDFWQILKSTDGGKTFEFIKFNVPGALNRTLYPFVDPGVYIDIGDPVIFSTAIVQGRKQPGITHSGNPTFEHAARLGEYPGFDARGDLLVMSFSEGVEKTAGTVHATSNIFLIFSEDGGKTWSEKIQVNPKKNCNIQHIQPALVIGKNNNVSVSYYTQHRNHSIDRHLTTLSLNTQCSSTKTITDLSFNLPPTVVQFPNGRVGNYNNFENPAYCLGEYQGMVSAEGKLYLCWADCRNLLTHLKNPDERPLSGKTQTQQDVFFQMEEFETVK